MSTPTTIRTIALAGARPSIQLPEKVAIDVDLVMHGPPDIECPVWATAVAMFLPEDGSIFWSISDSSVIPRSRYPRQLAAFDKSVDGPWQLEAEKTLGSMLSPVGGFDALLIPPAAHIARAGREAWETWMRTGCPF